MRKSGILLPIASLPSKYGIGAFSKEAYEFIDILEKSGQSLWQILPLGPTGYGDSPYQSFSTFAGNPYFIDLDQLVCDGLLSAEECESYDWGNDDQYIDYEKIYKSRFKIIKLAYERSDIENNIEFKVFCGKNKIWLEDYALYMAIKDSLEGKSWIEWNEDIRIRQEDAMEKYKTDLQEEVLFYKYQQYIFSRQWDNLKSYANKKGISIVGDIPIYVALDSSDTWANPTLFQLDEDSMPIAVAGCPPDSFCETGQLWGNPLYNWEYHKKTDFDWWIKRIEHCFRLYDIVRIDHFRGFDEYYAIPYGDENAINGTWKKGPGIELFNLLKDKLGKLDIIAEDLGFLTDSVKKLLLDTGYPGMKILQFAFDSSGDSDYLPHNYERNCVVYTGTHDNNTIRSWYKEISNEDRKMSIDYMNNKNTKSNGIHWDFICLAMMSVANTCIIPVQDYLGLEGEARINTPSTLGANWCWRMKNNCFSEKLVKRIRKLTALCGRV